MNCPNCHHSLKKRYKFCPECGQKVNEKLTVGVLFHNTISNYFSVDARFFRSFLPLMHKPGYLSKKFVEGKRLTYLHPAQFYLFISVVFFFLFSFSAREQQQKLDSSLFLIVNFFIDIPGWFFWIILLINCVYLCIGIVKFYQKPIGSAISKTIGIVFLNFLVILPLTFLILVFASLLFY